MDDEIEISKYQNVCIHKESDLVVCLYTPDGFYVGDISSEWQLNDVRIQIQKENVEGYYIEWDGHPDVHINRFGMIIDWPNGFFDKIGKQSELLLKNSMKRWKDEKTSYN